MITRRRLLGGLGAVGASLCLAVRPEESHAEPPPETTRVRLDRGPGASCANAPTYLAEELLRAEGFVEVEYVPVKSLAETYRALAAGEVNLSSRFTGGHLIRIDTGDPIVILAGVHVGCFELFGTERIRAIRDLKGKTIGVAQLGSGRHIFVASLLAYVGLDPRKDVRFVAFPPDESRRLLAEGKIDAYIGFAEENPEIRARKIGHVVMNSTTDRPWSQYFCCMLVGNREFVRKHPAATKRALRAILKAADLCALQPERAAQGVVDKGSAASLDYASQMIKELPYGRWRELNPEDTVRFYALRLHEVGMIKSSPKKLIAQGTDWRFLNELKKELKG